tara:strand:- start:19293 stop:20537 length:1245 start_codon:yes stop_codon:yes gene_type:complete
MNSLARSFATLSLVFSAGLFSACDVQTYDDAAAAFNAGGSSPPPTTPPVTPPPAPPTASFGPNFSEIQAAVLTPDCATSNCHSGANPQASLSLEEADSYAMLVGIASTQDAGIQRVVAGNPNNSYLIQKLEGTAATGTVMPPTGGLPQVDIDVIRQWISDGAIDDRVVVVNPIRLTSLSPAPGATLDAAPSQIVAGFDRELDASTVNAMTFTLFASGGDGSFNSGNEVQINATSISVPGANPSTAVFDLTGVALADDSYQVTLLGTGASVIMDIDANALDGEFSGTLPSGNGVAGGTFQAPFTVTTPVVLGPTLDQIQATVFSPLCSSCHNGAGANLPGSLNLSNANASFAALVNIASVQNAAIMRVAPNDPDNSYLIHKLEGTGGVTIMPPSGMLPAATTAVIRQWISDGAVR